MLDKKPGKPAPATPDVKTTTTTNNPSTRPSLPSLSPINGAKPEAPNAQAPTPAATTTASEKAAQPASAPAEATAAPTAASKPVSTEAKPAASPAPASKPAEKLGPKLRRKDEILKALRAGGKIVRADGIYRIVNPDGSMNATSKRRILSLESQKLLVASADGNSFTLDVAADKQAQEPKPVVATKPATEETK
jgi:hypothetical protein